MIDTLYVNGDSWSAGAGLKEDKRVLELAEENHHKIPGEEHFYAWPAWLAKELEIPLVINESTGGGSNARIVRMVCNRIAATPDDKLKRMLVVLGFTQIDRDEIYLENERPYRTGWFKFNYNQPFSAYYEPNDKSAPVEIPLERIRAIDKYRKMHITEAYEERGALETFYNQVFLLKNLLENKKVPYVFFSAIGVGSYPESSLSVRAFMKKWEMFLASPQIISLRKSMQEYVEHEWGLPLSTCIHPLLDGHQAWASFLAKTIRDRNIIGSQQ